MCLSPIQITRTNVDGSSRIDVVPCGKCAECRSKKHNDFAAEAVLEARAASSLYFFTLTYSNLSVPVARSVVHYYDGGQDVTAFDFIEPYTRWHALAVRYMGTDMNEKFKPLSSTSFTHRFAQESEEDFKLSVFTPSLRRRDVALWFKLCRVEWLRKTGEKLECRYAGFGEYGSRTFRPHYHVLIYNLSPDQASFMADMWRSRHGFVDMEFVPAVNKDGSPAHVKVAKYVSKYISKDVRGYECLSNGLVEAPRRFCSRGFGKDCLTANDVKSLKSFTNAPT